MRGILMSNNPRSYFLFSNARIASSPFLKVSTLNPSVSRARETDNNILESIGIDTEDASFQELLDAGWENPPKKGIVITSIRRGSSAHRRGMLNFVGYIITHIGEYEVQNMTEALEILKDFQNGTIVYFNVVGPDGYSTPISMRIP